MSATATTIAVVEFRDFRVMSIPQFMSCPPGRRSRASGLETENQRGNPGKSSSQTVYGEIDDLADNLNGAVNWGQSRNFSDRLPEFKIDIHGTIQEAALVSSWTIILWNSCADTSM